MFNQEKYCNVVVSEGCTAHYINIDGKNTEDMTHEEMNIFIDHMLRQLRKQLASREVSLESVIDVFQYYDYETDERSCEQCGDNVSRTYWRI